MLKFRCGKISELYIVLSVYVGRNCLSLFITPSVRDILLAILSVCGAQFNVSSIVVPRKLNSHMPCICLPSKFKVSFSFTHQFTHQLPLVCPLDLGPPAGL